MVIAVLAVYNEAALLRRAVSSLYAAGIEEIHVFDGAWEKFATDRIGQSTDGTHEIARELNCVLHLKNSPWKSQEAKRTYMFHNCNANMGDHILVADADEEFEGRFPPTLRPSHLNLMVKCVGENDMPGIRGEWPHGDYYPDYKPELRLFLYNPYLECKWPGGYWDLDGKIEPYKGIKSALPILEGVSFLHHGNDRDAARKAAKIAFYNQEHPKRLERQRKELG